MKRITLRKNGFKNLTIFILVIAAIFQTGVLWLGETESHNFFYSFWENVFADKEISKTDLEKLFPQKAVMGFGNRSFFVIRPNPIFKDFISDINDLISESLKTGEVIKCEEIDWQGYMEPKCVIFEFPFMVSSAEYIKSFGVDLKNSIPGNGYFNYIAVLPSAGLDQKTKIYFINTEQQEACEILADMVSGKEIYDTLNSMQYESTNDIVYISAKQSGFNIFKETVFVPQWSEAAFYYNSITQSDPYAALNGESEGKLEEELRKLSPDYSKGTGKWGADGGYVYTSEDTVIKYYPSGVLEYYNYEPASDKTAQTLVTAYTKACEFLKEDFALKNDIYLSGVESKTEGLTFYFDYSVDDLPIVISDELKDSLGLNHAIELVVANNSVRKYKKYTYNFIKSETKDASVTIDFSLEMNWIMGNLLSGEGITQVDNMELNYLVSGEEKSYLTWFTTISGETFTGSFGE